MNYLYQDMTYNKEYYKNNKTKFKPSKNKKANDIKYRLNNKEKLNKRKQIFVETNFEWAILCSSRRTAKRKSLEWDLTKEDIIIPEICPYLKIKLTKTQGKGYIGSNASIDRIDSSKGYVKGNIQVISRKANTMKSNASKEELIIFANSVLELHGRLSSDKPNLQNNPEEIDKLFLTRFD